MRRSDSLRGARVAGRILGLSRFVGGCWEGWTGGGCLERWGEYNGRKIGVELVPISVIRLWVHGWPAAQAGSVNSQPVRFT
jgi:hypothetical protein